MSKSSTQIAGDSECRTVLGLLIFTQTQASAILVAELKRSHRN